MEWKKSFQESLSHKLSRQFLEKKHPAPSSTGGRKKKSTAKTPAPVKDKSGSKKGKEPIVFTEPPSQTRDEEESASTSDRTGSQKTDENPSDREGPFEEDQSATSLDNTGTAASLENTEAGADGREEEETPFDNDQKIAANIVRKILEEIELRVQAAAAIYREWHERLKEIEENVISLTSAKDPNEAMDRHTIVKPRTRLQKLTVHIRKLTERYVAGTPKAKLQLLVLDMLEVKKGEVIDEIDRLDAVHRQRETAHSPRPETNDGQNRGATPPLADPVINETDERTETPFTGPFETDQPGDSEPIVIEERVKTLIQEFTNSKVRPWKRKIKKVARQTILLAEKTRDDLVKAEARITDIEADYRDDTVLHNDHLKRTEDLEDKTSRMVDDIGRFERETEKQITKVDEDLGRSSNEAASTLNRVISLEEKNASLEDRNTQLEADLKALTDQINELIKAKINADTSVEEEAPRLSEEEIAVRERNTAAKYPGLAKSMAAQAAKDAERLNAQKQGLEEYARAHKKTKAASSSSVPAKRKRKSSSRKVQVAGMLERITETVIETQPNPAMHTEDEEEANLEPRSTRQRVLNTVLISTVGHPQAEGSSSRPDQPDEEEPTDAMMKDFIFSESE
ncbi:DEK domain-containing chromatin-associated protein 4-like [Impatiens glandulifera]|uniref:DEK domain-containing chromatin-associated protein 4-like n=1 Tax=Impatiens glandulifera TaxID=253017 RepID=UPI001FB15803|nr:DEK domain-containing chromatin-associated protein 4-like [Impatiens glandulifera]